MLPDVDADDGDVAQKRILVGGRDDLQTLGEWVVALVRKGSRVSICEEHRC